MVEERRRRPARPIEACRLLSSHHSLVCLLQEGHCSVPQVHLCPGYSSSAHGIPVSSRYFITRLIVRAGTPLIMGAEEGAAGGGGLFWRSSFEGGVVSCARPEVVSSRAATRLPIAYGTSSSPASGRTCPHTILHQRAPEVMTEPL